MAPIGDDTDRSHLLEGHVNLTSACQATGDPFGAANL
jgi:hypothetical protein